MHFGNERKLCSSCENDNLEKKKKTPENRETHLIMSLKKNQ